MFMLEGESFIQDLIVNIYINMSPTILNLKDQFEIQSYLSKQLFDDALKQGKFYK